MDEAPSLRGLGVLVTRPEHQADNLCRLIESHHGVAIRWPTVLISAPRNLEPARHVLGQLATYDLAIFTSVNAVERALPIIHTYGGIPERLEIAAVGRASSQALARQDITHCLQPEHDFSSEGLLALPRLCAVADQHILLVCGEGGRDLLAETLRARGAQVDRAEMYRRERPTTQPETLLVRWRRGEIGATIATSRENLGNLFDMLEAAGQDYLRDTPLVVASERIWKAAVECGCHRLLLARNASDDAILAALLDLTTNSHPLAR